MRPNKVVEETSVLETSKAHAQAALLPKLNHTVEMAMVNLDDVSSLMLPKLEPQSSKTYLNGRNDVGMDIIGNSRQSYRDGDSDDGDIANLPMIPSPLNNPIVNLCQPNKDHKVNRDINVVSVPQPWTHCVYVCVCMCMCVCHHLG